VLLHFIPFYFLILLPLRCAVRFDTAHIKRIWYGMVILFLTLLVSSWRFWRHLTPSSELKVSRLFSAKCHFGGNELVYGEEACRNWSAERVDSLSVLKKALDDVETSATN